MARKKNESGEFESSRVENGELPTGWMRTTLGAVLAYGKCEKSDPTEISDDTWVLELEDIEKDTSKILQRLSYLDRKSKSTKNKFYKGDVLYGKLRPYLNKVVIADKSGVCTTEIIPLSCGNTLDNRFLFYWLKHPEFIEYVSQVGYGVNMPRLGTSDGQAAPFISAPLPEQKVIAEKLDALLAQVDSLNGRLDAIPAVLKRFRQSVLSAAVSGKLTEDWRGKSAISNWVEENLGDICQVMTGKTPSRSEVSYWDKPDVPWLTSSVTGQPFCSAAEQFISIKAQKECGLKLFSPGTLLLAMYGEGKTRGQVTELKIAATCNQACAAVVPDGNKVLTAFVKIRLEENYEETRKQAAGGAQPNLNLNKVREIPVILPPLPEQIEIVRRVEQLFAFADQVETRVKAAQSSTQHLTQAILAKAFRGELTAEWRAANQ